MLANTSSVRRLLCLVFVFNMSGCSHACESGWFGEGCRSKCHCLRSTSCGQSGECLNGGSCSPGYFGPGCQYVDAAQTANLDTERFLIDVDESTCNPNSADTSVTISWTDGIAFTWFRLHVDKTPASLQFQVTINKLHNCTSQRVFLVSDTSMDVTCDFDGRVSDLQLTGKVAPDVCSIYVSGGRNVALRQQATQSSNFGQYLSHASHAVDGNSDPDYDNGHCSHTATYFPSAVWSLKYDRPYIIHEIYIYNRNDYAHRIKNFALQTLDEKGKVIDAYREERNSSLRIFDIHLSSLTPVVAVRIYKPENDQDGRKILTLCEVETYGEAVCPDNYYGLWCDNICQCNIRESCFTVTGACDKGCQIGAYGFKCSHPCPINCLSGYCYQRLGSCEKCRAGYSGTFCKSACDPGTYGQNCEKRCSKYCENICDSVDGTCTCREPHVGSSCAECPVPFYGDNCSDVCPKRCSGGLCALETGECFSCDGERIGFRCEGCPPMYYGSLCLSRCSDYCGNETCDANTGVCSFCTDGYTGLKCNTAPSSLSWLYLIAAVSASTSMTLFCIWCFLRRVDTDNVSEAESDVTTASPTT